MRDKTQGKPPIIIVPAASSARINLYNAKVALSCLWPGPFCAIPHLSEAVHMLSHGAASVVSNGYQLSCDPGHHDPSCLYAWTAESWLQPSDQPSILVA